MTKPDGERRYGGVRGATLHQIENTTIGDGESWMPGVVTGLAAHIRELLAENARLREACVCAKRAMMELDLHE